MEKKVGIPMNFIFDIELNSEQKKKRKRKIKLSRDHLIWKLCVQNGNKIKYARKTMLPILMKLKEKNTQSAKHNNNNDNK